MKNIETINKFREYLNYLEEHFRNVYSSWEEFCVKCRDEEVVKDEWMSKKLEEEICSHDLSKLSPEEFCAYRLHYYPTEEESKLTAYIKSVYDRAWEHHKNYNAHHFYNLESKSKSPYEGMVNIAHLVIDLMAMSKKFGDTPYEYYKNNIDSFEVHLSEGSLVYLKRLLCKVS